jgi:hypothetical protein
MEAVPVTGTCLGSRCEGRLLTYASEANGFIIQNELTTVGKFFAGHIEDEDRVRGYNGRAGRGFVETTGPTVTERMRRNPKIFIIRGK